MTGRVAAGLAVAGLAMLVACHTDAFTPGFYGATGALSGGAEVRLTYADTNEDGVQYKYFTPTWAPNGSGILYSFLPRTYAPGEKKTALRCILNIPCRPVAADPLDQCLAMMPATGGSAYWNICESRTGHSSSTERVTAGSVNRAGQVLYLEDADLWIETLGDPSSRRVLTHFSSNAALTDVQWTGTNRFVAILGGSLVEWTIGDAGLTTRDVSPGANVSEYALVDNNSAAIYASSDRSVRRMSLADGSVAVVGTLPLGPGGQILDIGCHPDLCVVLASAGGTPGSWNLWRMDVASGSATIVRAFDHPIMAAKLSPASGDVVALELTGARTNLYLIPAVIP